MWGCQEGGEIENDESEISDERLEQISKVLGVKVQDILSFDEKLFFNVTTHDNSSVENVSQGSYIVNNNTSLPESERKLWEDKTKLLEEMNEMLKKENERLKQENERLKNLK